MKSIALLAFLAVFATSCHVTTSPNTTNTTSGSMTATVNGHAWSTIGIGSLVQSAHATRSDSTGLVTVTGADVDLSSITLTLLKPTGPATVSLGATGNEGVFAYGTVLKDAYVSATGTVTITKFDTVNRLIGGSFNFTGYQVGDTTLKSVSVTNGTFVDVGWSK